MTKLTFDRSRRQNNLFVSTVAEIPATVTLEAKGLGLRYVLRADFGTEDQTVIGDYPTLESATYAATAFFADDLNALNGIDVPRMDRQ